MEGQVNNEPVAIEPEKKHRGRPAKTIQSGVTVVDNPTTTTVIVKEQDAVVDEEPKKKRGRKPKEQLNINGPSDETIKKSIQASFKKVKKQRKQRVVKNKTMHCKDNRRINKIIRGIKANRFSFSFKNINIPKISIDLSGIKLPKGLTWGQLGAWSIAVGALIVAAVK